MATIRLSGNTAARPSAAAAKYCFYYDTEAVVVYESDGSNWHERTSLDESDNNGHISGVDASKPSPGNFIGYIYNATDTGFTYESFPGAWFKVPSSSGGVDSITDIPDFPNSFAGQSGKIPAVKGDETGMEFITPSGGGGALVAARIRRGSDQHLPTDEMTPIVLNSNEREDIVGMVGEDNNLIAPSDGWYEISLQVYFESDAIGTRGAQIVTPDDTYTVAVPATLDSVDSNGVAIQISKTVFLHEDDAVSANAYQVSTGGGQLDIFDCKLQILRLGDGVAE